VIYALTDAGRRFLAGPAEGDAAGFIEPAAPAPAWQEKLERLIAQHGRAAVIAAIVEGKPLEPVRIQCGNTLCGSMRPVMPEPPPGHKVSGSGSLFGGRKAWVAYKLLDGSEVEPWEGSQNRR